MKKGQVSIEMLIMIGFVIFISSIVLFGISEKNAKIEELVETLHAKRSGEKLASAVNNAIYSGDGFTTNITLSRFVGNVPITSFIVHSNARTIEIRWTGPFNTSHSVLVPLATTNVRNSTVTDDIGIYSNILNIYNNASTIYITQYNT